jgi:hypothetical protein
LPAIGLITVVCLLNLIVLILFIVLFTSLSSV